MIKQDTDAKGIPLTHDHPASKVGLPIPVFYVFITTVFLSISMSIAYFAIYNTLNKPKFDKKIELLASFSLGWLYIGSYVLKLGQLIQGIRLGQARSQSKAALPDQHVYKVQGAAGSSLGYVLMENEGDHGVFNRAQRAVQNYNEQFPLFVLYFVLASFVFPFEAFSLACGWAATKVLSTMGYTAAVDSRMPGTVLSIFCVGTLEALVLISGVGAIQAEAEQLRKARRLF